jgi:8-oxo-dGTP pyrophosphatase MutT (NUDIX family)
MKITNVAKTIVLDASGRVLLIRRAFDDEHRPGEWDLPGGGANEGESPVIAAMREAEEETGIKLHEAGMRLVYTMTKMSSDRGGSVNRFAYATSLPGEQVPRLSHEHVEYQWLPIEEALREFRHPVYGAALRYAVDNGLLEF